jgi:hypothetical protein
MIYNKDDLMVKMERIESFIKSLTPDEEMMSVQAIIKYTSLSYSTIMRATKRGTLKPFKEAGKKLFRRIDVDRWLNG